ncbi:hypothetical protein BST97_11160 [Nonlabens spongiae]|uniref:Uncharacterized protein n=1 Tax=Nonlabens spongiae TaxID=331648 RepID=A0A1W6MLM0_9FLAO|nr:outer membrane beta-barrel protein [Nonlabens spongiae]ARN78501.1 hypothetical protein BST97_11160 [Nonlabens spongiae]
MSDKKNIDRLYQERFKEFEPTPPADMWSKIEKELPKEKKRRITPFWYYGGIAAGLALLLSLFLFQQDNDPNITKDQFVKTSSATEEQSQDNSQTEAVASEEDVPSNSSTPSPQNLRDVSQSDAGVTNASVASQENNRSQNSNNVVGTAQVNKKPAPTGNRSNPSTKTNKSSTINSSTDYAAFNLPKTSRDNHRETKNEIVETPVDERTSISATTKNEQFKKSDVVGNKTKIEKENQDALTVFNEKEQDSLANELVKNAVASEESKSDSLDVQQTNSRKFTGSTLIAPVYSNSLSGSSINTAVADNATQAGYNLSYGVSLAYDLNDRWSLRTGIHKTDVSYNTGDVRYASSDPTIDGPFATAFDASAVMDQGSLPTVTSSMPFAPDLVSNAFLGLDGELSQQLGYIEVPLEMRYKLINSRLNLSVAGGFSALFLQQNQVQIIGDNRRLDLGSDNNFRDFNQSANFGLGLDYGLTDRLGIMLEPMFKYQFNALSNDPTGFRPYTIAVYSGLTYKF